MYGKQRKIVVRLMIIGSCSINLYVYVFIIYFFKYPIQIIIKLFINFKTIIGGLQVGI